MLSLSIAELIGSLLLIAFGLALLGGATALWVKTRRVTVLLQLIASLIIFLACATHGLTLYLAGVGRYTLLDTLRTSRADIVINIALAIGILLFSFTYLLYALGHKRI